MIDDEDEEDQDKGRHVCVDCGTQSPPTSTNYTLIGPRHGWRLTVRAGAAKDKTMEWRCPTCWADHRKKPPQSQ